MQFSRQIVAEKKVLCHQKCIKCLSLLRQIIVILKLVVAIVNLSIDFRSFKELRQNITCRRLTAQKLSFSQSSTSKHQTIEPVNNKTAYTTQQNIPQHTSHLPSLFSTGNCKPKTSPHRRRIVPVIGAQVAISVLDSVARRSAPSLTSLVIRQTSVSNKTIVPLTFFLSTPAVSNFRGFYYPSNWRLD